jgi:hypothetical protein
MKILTVANEPIPEASTCRGDYGEPEPQRIAYMLATQFSNLDVGKNSVRGSCDKESCRLSVRHAYGEDVSSLELTIKVVDGKAVASSIHCGMTP